MKILIVEDEIMVARALKRMLGDLHKGVSSIVHKMDLEGAMQEIETNIPDLLLLDLNLNGEDGLRILSDCVAAPFQTIIVSANTDQAIQAFEYGVVDFVPKPFDEERLKKALDRLLAPDNETVCGQGCAEFLGIRKGGNTLVLCVDDVEFIKAADNYSEVTLSSGSVHLHEKNLRQLLQILPSYFQRIHKSHLVNMRKIEGLNSFEGSRYEVSLQSEKILPAGRKYVSALRERLL